MINCEREDRYGDETVHIQYDWFFDGVLRSWQEEDYYEEERRVALELERDEQIRREELAYLLPATGNIVQEMIILPALASSGTIFS